MNIDFYLTKNNLLPKLQQTLELGTGVALPLTGGAGVTGVTFSMRKLGTGVMVITDAPADIILGSPDQARYSWVAGDVDEAGFFEARWRITYSDGRSLDVPNAGWMIIKISNTTVP